MILASATGSSGHSLSAGGPILHSSLDCGVLNFLAPRTLAFRPLILPISSSHPIKMGLTRLSKADEVDIHLDGNSAGKLKKEQLLNVKIVRRIGSIILFRYQGRHILSQYSASSDQLQIGIIDYRDV